MSRRANPTLIGFFMLSALAILVAGVIYFGSGSYQGTWHRFQIYFKGSAAGLQVGAPVVLKGVSIGRVVSIRVGLYPEEKDFVVPVVIEIEEEKIRWPASYSEGHPEALLSELIEQGLRARLDMQSILTGQLRVEIGFFPETDVEYRGRDSDYPEIPAIPSPLEALRKALESFPIERIAASSVNIVEGLDRLINSPEVANILEDLHLAVVDARSMVQAYEKQAEPTGAVIRQATEDIRGLVESTRIILEKQGENLDGLSEETLLLLRDLNEQMGPAIISFRKASDSARSALDTAEKSFASANEMIGSESPLRHEILTLMKNLSDAARSLRIMTDYLERHPDALLRGKR